MSEKIVALVFQFVTHVINAGGYAGIAGAHGAQLVRHSAFPLKSSCRSPATWSTWAASILFLGGDRGRGRLQLGSAIAYWIGAKGGRPLVERYGKWVLMSRHDLDRMTGSSRSTDRSRFCGAHVAACADLCRVSRGNRQDAAAALSHLHFCGLVDLVFLPGLGRHEAGRDVAHRSAACEQVFHRFHLVVELALVAALVWFVWSHLNRWQEQGRSGVAQ